MQASCSASAKRMCPNCNMRIPSLDSKFCMSPQRLCWPRWAASQRPSAVCVSWPQAPKSLSRKCGCAASKSDAARTDTPATITSHIYGFLNATCFTGIHSTRGRDRRSTPHTSTARSDHASEMMHNTCKRTCVTRAQHAAAPVPRHLPLRQRPCAAVTRAAPDYAALWQVKAGAI